MDQAVWGIEIKEVALTREQGVHSVGKGSYTVKVTLNILIPAHLTYTQTKSEMHIHWSKKAMQRLL